MATDQDHSGSADHRRPALNHRSASGHLEFRPSQKQEASSAKWPQAQQTDGQHLLHWPQMVWTRRQSPDWKPRRASVAGGCQQQVVQNYYLQETSVGDLNQQLTSLVIGDHSGSLKGSKKFPSQRVQQQQQLQPHLKRRRHLTEATEQDNASIRSSCTIKVSSGNDVASFNAERVQPDQVESELPVTGSSRSSAGGREAIATQNSEHLHRQTQHHNTHRNERRRRPTCSEPPHRDKTTQLSARDVGNQTSTVARKEPAAEGCADSKLSHDLTLCNQTTSSTSAIGHQKGQQCQLGEPDRLNGSALNLYSSGVAASPPLADGHSSSSTTCYGKPMATGEPLHANCVHLEGRSTESVAAIASPAFTTKTMKEKLQFQDKQRKLLIISIALKKMISTNSDSSLNIECAACSSKCRSDSGSIRWKITTGGDQRKTRVLNANLKQRRQKKARNKKQQRNKQEVTYLGHRRMSRRRGINRSAQSKCSECYFSSDSNNQETKLKQSIDSEFESNQPVIDKTRDAEKATSKSYEDDNEHLQCTLGATGDYYGSEALSSKASFGSDLTDNEQVEENNDDNDDDVSLESLIVESWLDDNPDFVHDYFMRKASKQLIDDWLLTRAKVSNTNLMIGSQLDLAKLTQAGGQHQVSSASGSQHLCSSPSLRVSGGSPARVVSSGTPTPTLGSLCTDQQHSGSRMSVGTFRPSGSRNQSGAATPVRKISATDFESRTGTGFLRPMVSVTPDGRPTFLSQPNAEELTCHDRLEEAMTERQQLAARPRLIGSDIETDLHSLETSPDGLCDDKAEQQLQEANNKVTKDGVRLIFELVKNICNDLDIRTLLHKILRNIAVLINADKSSLFLVCGEPGDPNRHLVSQLFNVDQDSECGGEPEPADCITIPWNKGLVGYVAESGESVNIANCYEDPRFTNTVDQRTGYVTKHMLCAPIYDKRNEIVGVAQVINKRDGKPFTEKDETKFKRYLQFCGIGLRNAQSYENCQLENRRNQVLLDLARMVFEEQSTIEQVVYRIMLHTQSLLECQRCQVLLIDDGSDDLDHLLQLTNPPNYQQQSSATKQEQQAWLNGDHRKTQCCGSASNSLSLPTSHTSGNNLSDCRNQISLKRSPGLFSLVFDLECDGQDLVMHNNKTASDLASGRAKPNTKLITSETTASGTKPNNSRPFPINIGITGYVAMTGETLNIEDAHECERFDPNVDEDSNFRHKSILCMPIRNGQRQIIGVSQLINKKNGRPFNKNDEDLFEAFSIFCGLGIHNTLMYEKVLKVMAKQRVTFEVLSYHATAPLEEAKKLHLEQVPSCFSLNLASLKFNDFSLDEQFMLKSCLRFFLDLDLIRRFQIDQLVFCNWILSVQKNYRKVTYHPIVGGNGLKAAPVRYHNWRHAFNVSQMMFAILISTQMCTALGELETLALLIACLCHDLDHRGTNNSFQIKSASPLAELYSTSTMEHHHFDQCVMILNSQGNQILANLSPDEYSRVIVLLEEAILATDLANYFQKRELFFQLVNTNNFDWHNNFEHRSLLRCMLMTACDVAAITKPWSIQKIVADLVMSEFYQQGDIEKQELNIEPIDMMNRDKMSKLPEMQIGFIDSICAPIYTAFAKLFPQELSSLLEGCLANRELWVELEKQNYESRSDLASYLNNNSTYNANILPKIRNTSSPEVNMFGDQTNSSNESRALVENLENHIPSSTAKDQAGGKPRFAVEGDNQQLYQKMDCMRKSV